MYDHIITQNVINCNLGMSKYFSFLKSWLKSWQDFGTERYISSPPKVCNIGFNTFFNHVTLRQELCRSCNVKPNFCIAQHGGRSRPEGRLGSWIETMLLIKRTVKRFGFVITIRFEPELLAVVIDTSIVWRALFKALACLLSLMIWSPRQKCPG